MGYIETLTLYVEPLLPPREDAFQATKFQVCIHCLTRRIRYEVICPDSPTVAS